MPDFVKRSLIRSFLIVVTIVGALFVAGVIFSVREGSAQAWQIIVGLLVVGLLLSLNRWWYRQSGTRI